MANVLYSKTSPYSGTPTYGVFLDVCKLPGISRYSTDVIYTIENQYNLRPDSLANDLYGDVTLWWVFAARNPNTLKDPLFDFVTGTVLYLPTKDTLVSDLGI